MKEHKHAELWRALADGVSISEFEVRHISWEKSSWLVLSLMDANNLLGRPDEFEVRRKPSTMTLNGITFPEPVRKPLEKGQAYYLVSLLDGMLLCKTFWTNSTGDQSCLTRGLIQLTEEGAKLQAQAMLKGLEVKE